MFYAQHLYLDAVIGPFTSPEKAHLWVRTHPSDCEGSVYNESIINWGLPGLKKIRVPKSAQ